MRFPPGFVEQLRDSVQISDVIGKRIPVKRHGHEFQACCPFHKEKTPSFTMNNAKGFYHCFGCGAHGDAVTFVKEFENLSFPEAVERLAQESGIAVPAPSPQAQAAHNKRLSHLEMTESAAQFFEQYLHTPEGMKARQYIQERGLTETTLQQFRIGFAPADRMALGKVLHQKHDKGSLSDIALAEAGLLIRPDNNGTPYSRFRDRIIFPIEDSKGRVIGFGGRILGDGQPKYLNSPDTPLFHKGQVLYNHHRARRPAQESGQIIVAEGYMDVIALSQAGIQEVVAPLGTALTEQQLRLLWTCAPEVVLCLDGDAAGQRAMQKTAILALPMLEPGKSIRFATLPKGEDPDSLVKEKGTEAFRAIISNASDLAEWLWLDAVRQVERYTPDAAAALDTQMHEYAETIAHRTVQQHYREYFRNRIWQWKKAASPTKNKFNREALAATNTQLPDELYHERCILAALLSFPHLMQDGRIEEYLGDSTFSVSVLDNMRQAILEAHAFGFEQEEYNLRRVMEAKQGMSPHIITTLEGAQVFLNQFSHYDTQEAREQAVTGAVLRCFEACQEHNRKVAEQKVAHEFTDEAWQRFLALKTQ